MHTRSLRWLPLLAVALLLPAPVRAQGDDAFSWVRVGETKSRSLRMGVGYRTYTREGGPTVTMYGAVHIADPRYYDALTERLESHSVVLFEGVGPPGSGEIAGDIAEDEQAERTERRIRLLAMLAHRARGEDGAFPESLEALAAALPERERAWAERAAEDAWENEIAYRVVDGELMIESLGADGARGGFGADEDLSFDDQPPLAAAELGSEPGIQGRLAETFGLAFQLDEMDTTGEKYVNADLSIDEVDDLIREGGGDGSMLFDMIGGEGFMTQIAGFVLQLIERMPSVAVRGKVMLMEMLGSSEDIFEMGVPGMEGVFEVLIERRNERVMDDLEAVLESDRDLGEGIGIIYGAAHMRDMEARLMQRFGYEAADSGWLTSMAVNLDKAGISPMEMDMIRTSIRQQLTILQAQAKGE